MTRILVWSCLVSLLFLMGCNRFSADASRATFKPIQISATDVDAAEPVTVSAPDGGFYVAWVNHNANNQSDVMVARFDNEGAADSTRSAPVRVNQQAGVATAWRGDPPSLAVTDRAVYVLWTARVESQGKNGTDLYFSVSNDQGRSFGAPVKVNDDKTTGAHGMHSLAVAKDGRIYVAWLDERNIQAPKPSSHAGGHHMESNRELFVADSNDGGKTFSANRKVAENACPCCKTALAIAADGTLYASWRQVLPGDFRHIAVASSNDSAASFSAPVIVSDDKWVLHGCPVSGSSLSVDTNGKLRVVWFAAGEGEAPGLYTAESNDKGRTFSPRALLMQETVKGTPALATENDRAVAIWQGLGAQQTETKVRELGSAGAAVSVAANAELPSGAFSKDKLFVAYISTVGEKRSVWLAKVG
ncbi:MAG TPA: sialidase family protein [Pyrinomonadaceae bacterium]|nr:sialidase family protein [Pyrinomonadaceae bacterium]